MLSVGPVAHHFPPPQNIRVKSEPHLIGNVHYRQRPLNELTINTGRRLTGRRLT
jgi:hypothetical protein